ncbi:restriction endonuclease subunit S [Ruminococcus callidus]
MKTYESMKSSTVFWLGMIPEHWECLKIGSLFSQRKAKVSDKDYAPLSVTKMGILPQLKNAAKTNDGDNRKLVCAGDFVINSRSDRKGSCGVSELNGSVSLINLVLTPRSEWNNRYAHYLLRSQPFSEEYYRYGRGIVADLWTTRFSEMKNILLPVPPREEQDQIVRFLDWKVSEINKLILLRKKQIERLGDLKRTVVSHAVTRGLNSDVKMKDSGINWLGDIPENWRLIRINNIADKAQPYSIGDGDHGLIKPSDYTDSGIPYIRVQNLGWATEIDTSNIVYISEETNQKIQSSTLRPNDVLFAKTGGTIGKTAIVPESMPIANTTSHVGKITVSPQYCSKYVFYVLSSHIGYKQFWEVAAQKTTRPELTIGEIKQIFLTVPPTIEEQQDIVRYLDEQSEKINTAIANKQKQIQILQEFKTHLISDVVTGKIDVRGIEIPEYTVEKMENFEAEKQEYEE